MQNNTVRSEITYNNVTVVTTDNQINVTQPVTNVVEVISPGPMGPSGYSGPFIDVGNNTYATIYDIEITGSLSAGPTIISGSLTITEGSLLFGTASWAVNSLTASYVNPLHQIVFITGGLNVVNQTAETSLTITSGSTPVLTVTGSGVTVFGSLNYIPSPTAGGIYFNGTDFFLGF